MKNLFLVFVLSLFIYGCSQTAQNSKEKEKNVLELAYEKAASSTIYEDTIYLGFRFGMTEKEVDKHFDKLVKSKKVYIEDYTKNYKHTNNLHGMDITYGFSTEYFEGKLIRFKLHSDKDEIFTWRLFKEAKPDFHTLGEYVDLLGDKTYIEQKNNIVVLFKNDNIIYEDGKILPLYNAYQAKQDSIRNAESLSNF